MFIVTLTHIAPTPGATQAPVEQPTHIQRIEKDQRRGMYGCKRVRYTNDVNEAKRWATREAAERVAAERTDAYGMKVYAVVDLDAAEVAPVASLPLPTPGTVVATPEHDGVVTMTRADWDTIAAILRDMRSSGAVSGPQDEALASMSFVECTLVGA